MGDGAPVTLVSNGSLELAFPADADDADSAPEWLSETGAFEDVAELRIAAGLLPYGVQNPLWSDGAHKQRWIGVPMDAHIGFSATEAWTFPEGAVLVKHFEIALDERAPEERRRLETRFLVAAEGGEYYGLVYKWNDEQTDAQLMVDGGEDELEIVGSDGAIRQQTYTYPAQSTCASCHSASSGFVMGVRTSQINGPAPASSEGDDADTQRNQLLVWSDLGLFDSPVDESELTEYPRLAALDDASSSVEDRVRSYWDSNCSMCHHPAAPVQSWDARYTTPLAEQRVIDFEPRARAVGEDVRLVAPGAPERSLMYLRAISVEPGMRMPPLLRNRVDAAYVELLEEWISGLPH